MRFAIHPAYSGDEVETFLEQLPMMFDGEGEMLYDKRNQVKRFVLPSGRPVIVKRFKKPILIQRIIYGFSGKQKLNVLTSMQLFCVIAALVRRTRLPTLSNVGGAALSLLFSCGRRWCAGDL